MHTPIHTYTHAWVQQHRVAGRRTRTGIVAHKCMLTDQHAGPIALSQTCIHAYHGGGGQYNHTDRFELQCAHNRACAQSYISIHAYRHTQGQARRQTHIHTGSHHTYIQRGKHIYSRRAGRKAGIHPGTQADTHTSKHTYMHAVNHTGRHACRPDAYAYTQTESQAVWHNTVSWAYRHTGIHKYTTASNADIRTGCRTGDGWGQHTDTHDLGHEGKHTCIQPGIQKKRYMPIIKHIHIHTCMQQYRAYYRQTCGQT